MSTESPLMNNEKSLVNKIENNMHEFEEDEVDKITKFMEIESKKIPKLVKQDKIEKKSQDCKSQEVKINPVLDNNEKQSTAKESNECRGKSACNNLHNFETYSREKTMEISDPTSRMSKFVPVDSTENSNVPAKPVKQNIVNRLQDSINNFSANGASVAAVGKLANTPSIADEILAERRKSFTPMSSMEEENLRERLHLKQLRKCSEIVCKEQKYTKEVFRRLFQSQVSECAVFYVSN